MNSTYVHSLAIGAYCFYALPASTNSNLYLEAPRNSIGALVLVRPIIALNR